MSSIVRPKILTPIIARNPVCSMMRRVWIGCSHDGRTPGISVFARSSSRISSLVIRRMLGSTRRSTGWRMLGQLSQNRSTRTVRHSLSGFSEMVVSIIAIGAGSSADSDLPNFPTTFSTSGTSAIARSWIASTSSASVRRPPAGATA